MKKSVLSLLGIVAIIAILAATSIFGLSLGSIEIPSVKDGIKLGLDLKGGSIITYEAEIPANLTAKEISDGMSVARTVIRNRLNSLNYTEATVQITNGNRIRVEIPAITNPEEAVKKLGQTAVLQFRDADGKVGLSGDDIKSATAKYSPIDDSGISKNHVELTFKKEAVAKFADMTKKAAGRVADKKNYIEIVLDGEVQSSPQVDAQYASTGINSESCIITMGNNSAEDSRWLANIVNSGRLPFTLRDVELRSIGPTLGERALQTSLLAGLIGLLIVIIFMLIVYRLPGLVSAIALVFYTALVAVILAAFGINLSLPGIAGIILGIGMAVDANIVIFERIKEELRLGKTIKASIESGFKRAFVAIFDSNLTTLIAAAVLWVMGTGPVIGFAQTLTIGVLVSMFTAIVVSKFMLDQLVNMNIKSPKVYGI